jgi:nitroreductase
MTSTSATSPTGTIETLTAVAQRALRAPSVFNTQPWLWRVAPDTLELYADRGRQLSVTDPDGRMLTVSCGAALHHARIAAAAAGLRVTVSRFPEPDRPDLLARIRVVGHLDPDPGTVALDRAIDRRRTDRRTFGQVPVSEDTLHRLAAVAEANGAHLHLVRTDQMPLLAVATAQAAASELADPAYRAELGEWTHRPADSGDGVPTSTAVRQSPRRVPVRDYAPGDEPGLEAGPGHDRGAAYAVLFGDVDEPSGWVRGGEALSALLLTAVVEGLSAAPLSDAVEVAWPRRLMRELLAGLGEPYLVLRIGADSGADALPPVPRRAAADVITRTDPAGGRP